MSLIDGKLHANELIRRRPNTKVEVLSHRDANGDAHFEQVPLAEFRPALIKHFAFGKALPFRKFWTKQHRVI